MRTLKKNSDSKQEIEEYNSLLNEIMDAKDPLVSWQVNSEMKRQIAPVHLVGVSESFLEFTIANNEDFELWDFPYFFYCEKRQVIFKTAIKAANERRSIVVNPDEIKFVDAVDEKMKDLTDVLNQELVYVDGEGRANEFHENIVVNGKGEANLIDDSKYMRLNTLDATEHINTKIDQSHTTDVIDKNRYDATSTEHINTNMSYSSSTDKIDTKWEATSMSDHDSNIFETELSFVTLEDEDEMYANKRTSPRSKPPEGKMVTIQVADGSRPQATYPLYDLSRGGFAFLVFAKEEFNSGEDIHIKAFDTKKFETPMDGIVRSIREADEMGIQYKVGCQFIHDD